MAKQTGADALIDAARREQAAIRSTPVIDYHQTHEELLAALERIDYVEGRQKLRIVERETA